jgi:hypothetical protein
MTPNMQVLLARKLLFAAIVTMTSRIEAQVRCLFVNAWYSPRRLRPVVGDLLLAFSGEYSC